MLVLTRKRMEKLYIGGDICVTVVRLEGGQVRLGIDAPRHVPVVRAELRRRDEAEADLARLVGEATPSARGPASPCWTGDPAPLAGRTPIEPGPAVAHSPASASLESRSGSRKR